MKFRIKVKKLDVATKTFDGLSLRAFGLMRGAKGRVTEGANAFSIGGVEHFTVEERLLNRSFNRVAMLSFWLT